MSTITQQQADRFVEWYNYISLNVKDKEFDMNSFCDGNPTNLFKKNKCGTTGCLSGYLPVVFSEFCYPSIHSERPCLLDRFLKESDQLNVICKDPKSPKLIVSGDDYVDEDDMLTDMSNFFGMKSQDLRQLVFDDTDFKSREDMLYKMALMLEKYGYQLV